MEEISKAAWGEFKLIVFEGMRGVRNMSSSFLRAIRAFPLQEIAIESAC